MPALDSSHRHAGVPFPSQEPGAMSAVEESSETATPVQGGRAIAFEARLLRLLARRGDLLLAGVVIAVIGLMVIPLPTLLLDGLIATNLAASIALLMLSMYVP